MRGVGGVLVQKKNSFKREKGLQNKRERFRMGFLVREITRSARIRDAEQERFTREKKKVTCLRHPYPRSVERP